MPIPEFIIVVAPGGEGTVDRDVNPNKKSRRRLSRSMSLLLLHDLDPAGRDGGSSGCSLRHRSDGKLPDGLEGDNRAICDGGGSCEQEGSIGQEDDDCQKHQQQQPAAKDKKDLLLDSCSSFSSSSSDKSSSLSAFGHRGVHHRPRHRRQPARRCLSQLNPTDLVAAGVDWTMQSAASRWTEDQSSTTTNDVRLLCPRKPSPDEDDDEEEEGAIRYGRRTFLRTEKSISQFSTISRWTAGSSTGEQAPRIPSQPSRRNLLCGSESESS